MAGRAAALLVAKTAGRLMWFLPSYGRPQALGRLLASPGGLPPLHLILTADDPKIADYDAWPFERSVVPVGYRLGSIMRWLAVYFAREPFYGIINDDHEPVTPGWWRAMEQAASDRYIAIANSPPRGVSIIGGFLCFGGELVRAMGSLCPAPLNHNYTDNVWDQIAHDFKLGRGLPEILVKHHHPYWGTAPMDETYARGSNDMFIDGQAYLAWNNGPERAAMNSRVRSLLGGNSMNICIATPTMHGTTTAGYSRTIATIGMVCAKYGWKFCLDQVDGGDVVSSRNALAAMFLNRPEATHLLFVDSDSEVPYPAVEKLLCCGQLFVGLPFCKREINLVQYAQNIAAGQPPEVAMAGTLTFVVDHESKPQPIVDGLMAVRRVGFGCTLIAREVFEGLPGDYFARIKDESGELLSEDMSFCEKVREFYRPVVAVEHAVFHIGQFAFGARYVDNPFLFEHRAEK